MRQIQCTRAEFDASNAQPAGPSALEEHQIQDKCFYLSHFPNKSKYKLINLIHTRQKKKNKIILLMFVRIYGEIALKYHLT